MIFKEEMLLIEDKNGNQKEYAILVTFNIEENGRSYVLYTDYSKNEDNSMNVFASTYDSFWNLSPLIEPEEIEFVNEYIKYLEADIKLGINFL